MNCLVFSNLYSEHLQRKLAILYYYDNEFARTEKIGKFENTFAAGRVRRDIRTVFTFCPDSTFHSFCAEWYMYFNIRNKTNNLCYSYSMLSPANIHSVKTRPNKCNKYQMSRKHVVKRKKNELTKEI